LLRIRAARPRHASRAALRGRLPTRPRPREPRSAGRTSRVARCTPPEAAGARPAEGGLMRDVLDAVATWLGEGRDVALATVIETWGSAPRTTGSGMAVTAEGGLVGSVSGGCVETAVVEVAREVLKGAAPRLLRFGVADGSAWAVGLACGGTIE